MPYTAQDYSKLLAMKDFSETLLQNHFTLYQGYVANTTKLLESLDNMLKEGIHSRPEFAELKRRLGRAVPGPDKRTIGKFLDQRA